MKRMVSFLLAFTLVLIGIPFTNYGTMVSYAQAIYGTVDTTGDVNVRTGPGLAYDTIGSVKKGSTLDYLGDTSIDNRGIAWYRIDYKGNQNAWVSSKYGKLTETGSNDALGANTEVSMVQTPNVSVSSQSTAATNMVDCKVGDIVVFGTYEQDNIISNGQEPLYWRVLEREGNRVMLATRDLIDRMQFHDGINWREDAVWEASTIRGWLNSEFINTAFSISEQMLIEYSELTTQSESICTDRVFLLSKDEAATYFTEDTPHLTAYTEAKTGYYAQTDSYWLRTSSGNDVYIVNKSGYITYTGTEMTYGTVRPVMWLNLDITSDTNVITTTSTDYKIGDTVFIGSWEQDGDTANGMEPIAWQIIGLENDIATLLANSGLERRAYNSSNIDVTWERSTLRMWLNSEFFIEAFTPEEQTSIQLTQLSNPSVWSTYGGADTTDRVYLLSKYEIDELFPDEDSRRLSPTQYARSQGAGGGTYCVWWTRSPGARENYATRVYENGSYSNGAEVNYGGTCVRPVIRVSINSASLYKSDEQLQAQAEYVLPSRYNINDTVVFGRYEQDGDLGNGAEPLEWDILDIKNDQALIITDDVIDIVQYEDDGYKSDWENSYLREWLNSDFMAQAFTADEQSAILATEVDNSMSANGRKCDAAATIDSVFCLSRAELEALYATEKLRQGFTSLWVGMRERQENPNMLFSTAKYWWLRDSGVESLDALLVGYEGQLMQMDVDADFGVRPALWVELSKFESLDDARIAAEAKAAAEAEIAAQEAAAREAAAQQAAWEALPEDERVMRGLIEGASGTKCEIWCGDYDGNGIGEAFALAGEQDEFGRSELWYSDGNTAWRIDTSDGMGYEKSSTSYKTGNGMIFCAVDGFTSTSASRIWYVEDGQPVYASKGDDIGWVSQYGESDFSFTHDAYDASTDGTGHTWKRYYAYWDGDGFTEYGGIYINEAQLRGVEGASKWLDEIVNKGYRITGILYRNNGIVNINYSNGDANYNATLLIKDGIATLEIVDDDGTDALFASSYGGVYQTSVLTRATYPEEFPFEAAPAKSTVPEYNENDGIVTGDVISKQDILDSYGVFNFDELINIRSVEASKIDGGKRFDIWFEDDVYWGGTDGYNLDWLTTNGIIAEAYTDLDGDDADEYVIVHVDSEPITEYGYTYVENIWRVTVFEVVTDGYVLRDTMTVPLGWWGERFIRIIPNESGNRILLGSIVYWDGGCGGINLDLYQYNGTKLYLEMTAEAANDGISYMAALPISPDQRDELQGACNEYEYDVSAAYALGLVEGENFLYETRSDGDWQVWDSDTGAIIRSAFEAYQKVCDAVKAYGIDAGYTIHESGGYELWIRNGDNLIWASEDFEDGDALIRYDVCTALEYEMPSIRDAAESVPENITSGTVITTGNVNLRTGPGKGYNTVTSIGAGKTLAYLGETQYDDRNPPVAWHKVRLDNGTEAWISSKYGQLNGTEIVSDDSFKNLAKGSTGNRVIELQQMLAELGFHTGSCDGDYGNQTMQSVVSFQSAHGIDPTGEVDEVTWQAIEHALSGTPAQTVDLNEIIGNVLSDMDDAISDPYVDRVNSIDRTKLESWLANTDFSHKGYLLLEQMMDENGDFVSNRAAYDVMTLGTKLLHFDLLGIGMDVVGEFNADHEIEEVLLVNYAKYLSALNEEIELQERNQAFIGEVISKASVLLEYSDDFAEGLKVLDANLSYEGALQDWYKAKPQDIDKAAKLIREFYRGEMDYLIIHHGSAEECNKVLQAFEAELEDWEKDLPRLRQNYAHVQEVISGTGTVVNGLKTAVSYKESYEKYSSLFDYLIVTQAGFVDMLDAYVDAAESTGRTQYIQAITQFRADFYNASRERIIELSLQDNLEGFVKPVASVVKDTILLVAEKYSFKVTPTWLANLKGSKAFVVADLIGYAFDFGFWAADFAEKAKTLDQMVYIRNLKEILATSINNQLNGYDGSTEEAQAILAGIDFMKQLKYSGEEFALNLCKYLTTVVQYNDAYPERWRVAFTTGTNAWYVSSIGVSPASKAAEEMYRLAEEMGYTAKLLKVTDVGGTVITGVPTLVLDVEGRKIITYKEYVSIVGNVLVAPNGPAYVGFQSVAMLSSNALFDIDEAQAVYQSELERLEAELEQLQEDHKDDPAYYDWWENYVATVSKSKIEMSLK